MKILNCGGARTTGVDDDADGPRGLDTRSGPYCFPGHAGSGRIVIHADREATLDGLKRSTRPNVMHPGVPRRLAAQDGHDLHIGERLPLRPDHVAFDPALSRLVWPVALVYGVANAIDMGFIFPVLVAKLVNLHPLILIAAVFPANNGLFLPTTYTTVAAFAVFSGIHYIYHVARLMRAADAEARDAEARTE